MKEIFVTDPNLDDVSSASQAPGTWPPAPDTPTLVGEATLEPQYVRDYVDPQSAIYWKNVDNRTKLLVSLSNHGSADEAEVNALEKIIATSTAAAISIQKKFGNYTLKRGQYWLLGPEQAFFIPAGSTKTIDTTTTTSASSSHSSSIDTSSGIMVGTSKTTTTSESASVGLSFAGIGASGGASHSMSDTQERQITHALQLSTIDQSAFTTTESLSVSNAFTGGEKGRWYFPYQLVNRFVIVRSDGVQIAETEFLGSVQIFNGAEGS